MSAPLSPQARALLAAARGALDASAADLDRVRGKLWLAVGAGAGAAGEAAARAAPTARAPGRRGRAGSPGRERSGRGRAGSPGR